MSASSKLWDKGLGKEKKKSNRKTRQTKKDDGAINLFLFDSKINEVPIVVDQCVEYLEKNGLDAEGIFRLSGSSSEIEKLKNLYIEGKTVDLHTSARDSNDVAALLKLFFREMPEALLTAELYECFLAAIGVPDNTARIACIQKVLNLLPTTNRLVLARLMGLLNKISKNSAVNKMTPSNLAIVFAPTLYRPKEETFQLVMEDATHATTLMETLITQHEELFLAHQPEPTPEVVGDKAILEGFNHKIKTGTIRMAKKFLLEEKEEIAQVAEEPSTTSPEESPAKPHEERRDSLEPASTPSPCDSPSSTSPVISSRNSVNTKPVLARFSQHVAVNPPRVAEPGKLASPRLSGGDKSANQTNPGPQINAPSARKVSVSTGGRSPSASNPPKPHINLGEVSLHKVAPKSPVLQPTNNAPVYSLPAKSNSSSFLNIESDKEKSLTPPRPSSLSKPTLPKKEEDGALTAKALVDKLLEGKNVFVMNYLDTLEVSKRKAIVDEMTSILP
ncbi:hypothetical protein PROFUN_09276 [Planoprotostelium fungivorum]|uniref:Rho-GAP domain-containing protein n=1 Tax=Planoprotostelium fungivorum TaxID=1890364 RepID=A0A2P6NKX3_9EUKA|nr:hypothetical protein PROFUN_09276 [Planoprotostelium fungivorum]